LRKQREFQVPRRPYREATCRGGVDLRFGPFDFCFVPLGVEDVLGATGFRGLARFLGGPLGLRRRGVLLLMDAPFGAKTHAAPSAAMGSSFVAFAHGQ
jgi:hypothetical protein